jgi:hypothetical protein
MTIDEVYEYYKSSPLFEQQWAPNN